MKVPPAPLAGPAKVTVVAMGLWNWSSTVADSVVAKLVFTLATWPPPVTVRSEAPLAPMV